MTDASPWPEVEIRDFASIGTGAKDTKDRLESGRYPFFVRSQKVEKIDSWSFDGEAVLTAGDGVGTGKVFHYINGKFDYHQRVYRISNFRPGVSGRYFFYQFSRNFLSRIESLTAKSSVDSVRMETIVGMCVPLPTRAEQERIAEAIDDAEATVAALERIIVKKQVVKQGMMQELLTGRNRLRGFNGGEWSDFNLGHVLAVRHGKNQKAVEDPAGDIPILATGGQIGWARSSLYDEPSILIGRKGTIDRPQYQATPFWTVDTLFYTEISASVDPRFLYYVFLTVDWRSMNEASGVPSLSARRVENVEIKLPDIEEQRRIREVLDDTDAEIERLYERLAKAKAVKQGMMQELLTGRTRLPVEKRHE